MRIAVDGPSGVGKSSLSKEIALEFDLLYIDTGAMYRMIAFYFFKYDLDYENLECVRNNLAKINIDLVFESENKAIFLLNNQDVSGAIRNQEIAKISSCVAKLKCVRDKLTYIQKNIVSLNDNIIMDGRDIASSVMPDADIKFYLDADINIRTKRRMIDLNLNPDNQNQFIDVHNRMLARDVNDSQREFSPLLRVSDAVFIDTTDLTFDQVRQKMFHVVISKIVRV